LSKNIRHYVFLSDLILDRPARDAHALQNNYLDNKKKKEKRRRTGKTQKARAWHVLILSAVECGKIRHGK